MRTMGVLAPSLHRESTDSLITTNMQGWPYKESLDQGVDAYGTMQKVF